MSLSPAMLLPQFTTTSKRKSMNSTDKLDNSRWNEIF